MANSSAPLIPTSSEKKNCQSAVKCLDYTACFLVALPTAVLNGLAVVSSEKQLGEMSTPADLKDLLQKASTGDITYGVIALTASEIVLFYLNKRYLLASGKVAVDVMKRTALSLKSFFCRSDLLPSDEAGFGENLLFLWSIATSIIFAEIGGKALSFLGPVGEAIGGTLTFAVYFATRFASAKMHFSQAFDANWRLKEIYKEKIATLKQDHPIKRDIQELIAENERADQVSQAVSEFLWEVDEKWMDLSKDRKRQYIFYHLAPLLGNTLLAITWLPIMSSFIPESIQGTEVLVHADIGASANYQNAASISFGAFATALTLFFYELNIKSFPKHFLETLVIIYEKITQGNYSSALMQMLLTALAGTSSYFTGTGFKFVADSALSNGCLDYLGSTLGQYIPTGLMVGVMTMLWSHLQELINQETYDKSVIESVTIHNVKALLADPSIKLSTHRNSFHQRTSVAVVPAAVLTINAPSLHLPA